MLKVMGTIESEQASGITPFFFGAQIMELNKVTKQHAKL